MKSRLWKSFILYLQKDHSYLSVTWKHLFESANNTRDADKTNMD